jgi:hypothetical protein
MGGRRQASNRLLQLTFATPKPLFLLALKTVAKLTLCATLQRKKNEPLRSTTAITKVIISLYQSFLKAYK